MIFLQRKLFCRHRSSAHRFILVVPDAAFPVAAPFSRFYWKV